MLTKIKTTLCSSDFYKIVIIIICLNSAFEVFFQYRFQAEIKIEMIYFLVFGVISIVAVKNVVFKKQEKFLPVFYCFWPFIMLFIYFCSACKISLLPFLLSSFIVLFCGRYKRKIIQIVMAVFTTSVVVSIVLYIYFFPLILLGANKPEVIKKVYSFDNKYIMVLEEVSLGATGGNVSVYLGRNIDFGILGQYMPKKTKYHGRWGERPKFNFINDHLISINGEIIEMKGPSYLSNNEPYIESRQLDDKSAEGGEIIRYKNENGVILQYKVTLYGETGRAEENYYFMGDNTIYYTRLEEQYSSPISIEKEADILSRKLKEGIIINGQLYSDGKSKADLEETGDRENMYKNLEELNTVFDGA